MTHITQNPNYNNNYDFVIKNGSTKPALEVQLTDGDNQPVNLEGATVKFKMKQPGSDSYTVNSDAVVDSPEDGMVVYIWNESDTEQPGLYNAEFAVDYSNGAGFSPDEYFPTTQFMTVHIEESL